MEESAGLAAAGASVPGAGPFVGRAAAFGAQEEGDDATDAGERVGALEMKRGTSEPYGREIAVLREKTRRKVGEKQPVFLDDLKLGPRDDSFERIQVGQARSRVRINKLKNGHKVKPNEKLDDEKLNLTFRMMLGVRVAVGLQSSPFVTDSLEPDDFLQEYKYVFPKAGAGRRLATPSHKLNKTFKFRDYAPKVFKRLRGIFGIDEASYLNSVAGDYDYLELITNSKSGSFFFYSHDQKFIIKNMKRAEAKFFRRILPQYYAHHRDNPESFLIRFCGMYLVKNGHKKIPFIVMKCIDGNAQMKIHTKYDLKGSTVNRTAGEGDKVLKDNNLRKANTKFRLGSQRDTFLKKVRKDAEFLRDVNVMDYSMFISVHDASRPPERTLQRSYTEFHTFADEAANGPKAVFKPIPSLRGDAFAAITADTDGDVAAAAQTPSVPPNAAGTPGDHLTMRFRADGGINSEGSDGPEEIYWMGVIDVLQVYTKLKHMETWYKGIGRVSSELSCVDPDLYCERFVGFLEETTT